MDYLEVCYFISKCLKSFLTIFLLLISTLAPLWLQNVLCLISVLLSMLIYFLWPRIWSILVHVSWALEKKCVFRCCRQSILYISARSCWLIVLFRSYSLPSSSCLVVIAESGIFKSLVCNYGFVYFSDQFLFHSFGALSFGVYTFKIKSS